MMQSPRRLPRWETISYDVSPQALLAMPLTRLQRVLSYATGKDRLVLAVALISAIASGVVCCKRAALE